MSSYNNDFWVSTAIPITTITTGSAWNAVNSFPQVYGPGSNNAGHVGGGGINWTTATQKPSIKSLSEALKDDLTKKIILCKNKEECKETFGSYGLEILESLLGEVLQEAIKSEEAFVKALSKEKETIEKLRAYISEHSTNEEATLRDILHLLNT